MSVQSLSVPEILAELQIVDEDYYRTFYISNDNDLELHLKRKTSYCFINNYFDDGLKAWHKTFRSSDYKAVTYMIFYFFKCEDQCSQAMRNAAKEIFESNLQHCNTMITISQAYLSKLEYSVQEAVYLILLDFKVRRVFIAVHFVCTNVPGEKTQVLLSKKELMKLPVDSSNIFKKLNIDRYIDRPNGGKYNALFLIFTYAEFTKYYTVNKN